MHPALSIIAFTTLSGAGFGLIALIGLGLGPRAPAFGWLGAGFALALTAIGLVCSLGHLGNPQRAWRALSQWRSSWLSREGVLAIATLAAFGLYALAWVAGFGRIAPLGALAALLALASVLATSMIYASIGAVPRWSKTPTPLMFIGYAFAGGALALASAAAPIAGRSPDLIVLASAGLIVGALTAWLWSGRAAAVRLDADGSTPETAIGLPHLGRARLFEAPHSAPNYLMREMVYRVARRNARALRRIAVAAAFVLPLVILGVAALLPAAATAPLLALALVVHLGGVAAARWLFFAEAEHVVSLYYGHR